MDSKTCNKCGEIKPITDFYAKLTESRVTSWCRKCLYKYQRQRWADRKIRAITLFGGKCSVCSYCKNFAALDFHHADPSTKDFMWTTMKLRPWQDVVNELKKCVLLCRNCHAEYHYPQWNNPQTCDLHDNDSLNRSILPTGECPNCAKPVYGTKYCSDKCAHYASRRAKRPRRKTLIRKLATMSWTAIGREYKVSDSAVRKWAKAYGIGK